MSVKILVVDDEPDLHLLIRQKFKRQTNDWTFVFADDGVDALERIEADSEIDLVLTDINMPRMDGLTLLARIAEMDRPLRVVIVSAYGDMKNIRAAMNQGAYDFVTKPVNLDDLEATIYKTWQEVEVQKKALEAHRQLEAVRNALAVSDSSSTISLAERCCRPRRSRTVKVDPKPSSLSTKICPPCNTTSSFASDRPMPVPG